MQKSKASKRVTVVTVAYNSAAVIEKCLKSIPEAVVVYVVDNASSDGCLDIAKAARPDIKIIKNTENIGFGRANNIALAKVQTEFALVLNPDTVMQGDTIDKLLEAADTYEDAAIIAPAMFFEDGKIQAMHKNSVFKREKKNRSAPIKGKGSDIPEGDLCAECLSGAAMLLRMKMFRKTGFFDPNIFLFYEDDDLCLKMRQAGYSLVLAPAAKLVHMMGRSSPITYSSIYLKNWHMMWSRLFIEKKYNGQSSANALATKEMCVQIGKAIGHLAMLDNDKTIKSIARLVAVMAFMLGINSVKKY